MFGKINGSLKDGLDLLPAFGGRLVILQRIRGQPPTIFTCLGPALRLLKNSIGSNGCISPLAVLASGETQGWRVFNIVDQQIYTKVQY